MKLPSKHGDYMNILNFLRDRGFVHQVTDEQGLLAQLQKPTVFYIGFDPTANSLHVGSLMGIMLAAHLQRQGHIPIMLVGGGTGLIGDPSGKKSDRAMLTLALLEENVKGISAQLKQIVNTEAPQGYFLNNNDWLATLSLIPFLRDVGVHFRVNEMVKNDTYKLKMDSGSGLSFVEFNYQILQAYDFLHLFKTLGCVMQVGGSDQWGNITAGTDLIRKHGGAAFGLTMPLITTSEGKKMGKTESGAVWLDATKTSPYDFYQFWRNCSDADVFKFLNIYTFLSDNEIASLPRSTSDDINNAKKLLAFSVTKLIHGEDAAVSARDTSEALFGKDVSRLSAAQKVVVQVSSSGAPMKLMDVLRIVLPQEISNGEIRRRVSAGAIKIDDVAHTNINELVTPEFGRDYLVVDSKKRFYSVSFEMAA